jgi:hypothetical protein
METYENVLFVSISKQIVNNAMIAELIPMLTVIAHQNDQTTNRGQNFLKIKDILLNSVMYN